jgi:hypothetical protein
MWRMSHDHDGPEGTSPPDLSEDDFWTRYLVTCAALGVQPMSVERARELVAERSRAIAAGTMALT